MLAANSCLERTFDSRLAGQHFEQIADVSVSLDRVPEWFVFEHLVVVLTTDFFTFEESAFFKIDDDSLDGPLGNPNSERDMSEDEVGLAIQNGQNVGVIGEESPLRARFQSVGRHFLDRRVSAVYTAHCLCCWSFFAQNDSSVADLPKLEYFPMPIS